MRKVALSQNLMEHQISRQLLLSTHCERGQILGFWFTIGSVQARLTML